MRNPVCVCVCVCGDAETNDEVFCIEACLCVPLSAAPCVACILVSGTRGSCSALFSAEPECAAGTSSHRWKRSLPATEKN